MICRYKYLLVYIYRQTVVETSVHRFARRKIGPISTRCNPCPSTTRSVGFFTLWNHRNIAPGAQSTAQRHNDRHAGESLDFGKSILKNFGGLFCVRSIPSSDGSELYLCPTTCGLSDKGARPAGRVRRSLIALLPLGNTKRTEAENELESCGIGR